MLIARTSANNQWADDAFYAFCGRSLRESEAELTQESLETLYTEICKHAIPGGNA